ncbi:DUF1707 SHOCT-like domain-containing protein [Ferrimicrobium acidiphilum]|uniref:DUF1707 SHOCT-like domain-containing protein n=1 Tax=Ferrimicrobium acidiphilum TaxID=121039 RepID=UPI0023F44A9B|nr:DUF1707 domain-containing protein [Ferrimicrobium acidiphilum]
MAIDPMHIRNSASDRERVESLLRKGFEDGRLTQSEFTDRLERVHTTVSYADLVALVEDLPYDYSFLYEHAFPSRPVEPTQVQQPLRRPRSRSVLIAFFAFSILAGAAPAVGPLFILAGLIFLLVALPRRRRHRMMMQYRYQDRYRRDW